MLAARLAAIHQRHGRVIRTTIEALRQPVRYAHTPDSLAALRHYLKFATRLHMLRPDLLGIPGAFDTLSSAAINRIPTAPQAAAEFYYDGEPSALQALLDLLQEQGGYTLPARPHEMAEGSPGQSWSNLDYLMNHLRGMAENVERAATNQYHVSRMFTPGFVGRVGLTALGMPRRDYPAAFDQALYEEGNQDASSLLRHGMNDAMSRAAQIARQRRLQQLGGM